MTGIIYSIRTTVFIEGISQSGVVKMRLTESNEILYSTYFMMKEDDK